MAQPSNPKWGDFLQERTQKEGSWAKINMEKALDALDSKNSVLTPAMLCS